MGGDLDVFVAQRAILQSALSTPEKITALALLSHWSRNGKGVFPSHTTLADETSLGVSTVNRTLGDLEAKGLIRRVRAPGRPTRYDLRGLAQLPSERDPQGEGTLAAGANHPQSEGGPPSQRGTKGSKNRSRKGSRGATSSSEPQKATKGWRKVPKSWQPRPEARQLARELNVDFDEQLARYRDHTFKSSMLDADGTFRNWLRKAAEWNRQRGPRKANGQMGLAPGVMAGTMDP